MVASSVCEVDDTLGESLSLVHVPGEVIRINRGEEQADGQGPIAK